MNPITKEGRGEIIYRAAPLEVLTSYAILCGKTLVIHLLHSASTGVLGTLPGTVEM
jgi:hypothetical protein